MSCFISNNTVNGDRDNMLKHIVDAAIGETSIPNKILAAGYLYAKINERSNFLAYIIRNKLNSIENYEYSDKVDTITDTKSIIDAIALDGSNKWLNTQYIKEAIIEEYTRTHLDVNNYNTVESAMERTTFTSMAAEDAAVNYVADLLEDVMYKREFSGEKIDINEDYYLVRKQIFRNNIIPTFLRIKNAILNNDGTTYNGADIEKLKSTIDIIDNNNTILQISKEYKQIKDNKEASKSYITSKANIIAKVFGLKEGAKFIENEDTVKKVIDAILKNNAYKIVTDNVISLIKQVGNEVEVNQATIFTDMLTERFRKRIKNSNKLYNYSGKLDSFDVFNEDVVDEDDANIYEAESVDESTKRWNERTKNNFMNYISKDIRYRLGRIHKFATKYDYSATDPNEDIARYYDTSNIIGTPVRYNAQEVIKQLMAFANTNSMEDFIRSIQHASEVNPFLYGFAEIVLEMKKNPMFANSLWAALARPVVDRTMIIIREEGLSSEKSNINNTAYNSMVNKIMNDVRTHSLYYDSRHKVRIDDISIKSVDLLKYIKSGDGKGIEQIYKSFIDLYRVYVPSVSEGTIINAIKNANNDKEQQETINKFISLLRTIINSYDDFNKNIDQKRKNKTVTPADYIFNVNSNDLRKACIELASMTYEFEKSTIELNSYNAEGNLSSNMIDNCYLTRIFELIKSDNEEALIALGKEIKDSPQYKYSPIYFGIKSKGIKGIFNVVDDVVTVNKEVINSLKYSLFDGIRTENYTESSLYDGMHEGDYFLTMIQSYFHPTDDISINSVSGVKQTASDIFLPIPSDKPQNFMITMPRYTDGGVVTVTEKVKTDIVENNKRKIDEVLGVERSKNNGINLDAFSKKVSESLENKDAFNNVVFTALKKPNVYTAKLSDLENLFFSENPDYISAGITINVEKKEYRAVVYKNENEYHLIFVENNEGKDNEKSDNANEKSNIVFNPKIIGYMMLTDEAKTVNSGITHNFNIMEESNSYIGNIMANYNLNKNIEDVILNDIDTNNVDNETFNIGDSATRQALIQGVQTEMYAMVAALNDLFTDRRGNSKNIYLRKDTKDLVSPYHYSDKAGVLQKNGKLTGRVFHFDRLFDITFDNGSGYSANEELMGLLSLYGEKGIIKNNGSNLYIDIDTLNDNSVVRFNKETNRFEINFTTDVTKGINRIVNTWMNYFAHAVVENYSRFSDIINENGYTYDKVIEAMFGNVVSLQGITDLIYGNEKFYADSRTFFKRAKEGLAGGEAYALMDINTPDGVSLTRLQTNDSTAKQLQEFLTFTVDSKTVSVFDNYEIDGKTTKFDTNVPTNGWNAITIKNVVNVIEDSEGIYTTVYKSIISSERKKQNIPDNKPTPKEIDNLAKQIAAGIAGKFGYLTGTKTKVDDAQSYITFEEWCKRRVADGTINEYRDIIQQIMEVRYGVRKVEDVDFKNIEARIQVEKNYYYDVKTTKLASGNIRNPRQIKNAEFVLIPEFIKGTDLHKLYTIMRTYNIGQVNTVETSKASHSNILEFWDNNGRIVTDKDGNPKIIKDLKDNSKAIEEFSYKYLYKQLRVAQHMVDETNKAGIQLMKKLADNATDETRKYIDTFMRNYVANIKTSFDDLLIACGWKVNEQGDIVNNDGSALSYTYFMEKAKREAVRLGIDSNFAEYFDCDSNGKPVIPVWLNSNANKMESIVGGIFNSMITRQKLPGFHAAQVTGVGFGDSLGNGTSIAYSRNLKYNPEIKEFIENPYHKLDGFGPMEDVNNADVSGFGVTFPIVVDGNMIGEIPTSDTYKNGNISFSDSEFITVSDVGNSSEIDKDYRGKGYGKAAYIELAKWAVKNNRTLRSAEDSNRSEAANNLWKSLVKDGYAKKVGNRYYIINESLYTTKKEAYIEIMIPRNSKVFEGMTDEEVNDTIAKGKVNEMIVYRMPTEGKHSVAVAKVVGITPEVFGSTIILPHGWVTQTGSDFDVDSVYAITYHVKKNKDGSISKVTSEPFETETDKINAYGKYVKRQMAIRKDKGFDKEMEEVTSMYKEMSEESERLDKYGEDYEYAIKDYNEYLENLYARFLKKKKDKNGNNPAHELTNIIRSIKEENKELFTEKDGKKVLLKKSDNIIKYYTILIDKLKNNDNIDDTIKETIIDKATAIIFAKSTKEAFIDVIKMTKQQLYDTKLNKLNEIAERFGIASFEEFKKLPEEYRVSKEVRDNAILDSMIGIMKSISSAEERYSCSNFDDINRANTHVARITGRNKLAESPYNPLTQIKYFNDATSGMALKGKSVSRDTGLSLFNYMKAELTYDIPVIYNTDGSIEDNPVYDESIIKLAYEGSIDITEKGIRVRHNKLGHSKNNRNVVGKILTEYGSQTTAHILDAIKEGPIRNETLFTFDAFKLLIDVGVDYTTAISWLSTNGIQLICDKDANTESIYSNAVGNPVHRALRQLCIDNQIMIKGRSVNEYTPYKDIIEWFEDEKNTKVKKAKEVLGYDTVSRLTSNDPYAIITDNIYKRLTNDKSMTKEVKYVMDYITIRQFEYLDKIAKNVIKLQQVSNPDKFGAKQTLYETNDVLNRIKEYREDETKEGERTVGNTIVVKVDGKDRNYVDALYPLDENGEINIDASVYPFMAAFLKYSTIPSVTLSRELFQLDDIIMYDEEIRNTQTEFIGRRLTPKEYKEFKKYVIKYNNSGVEELFEPITINIETNTVDTDANRAEMSNIEYIELARLKGNELTAYQKDKDGNTFNPNTFSVADINNPTQEEVDAFAQLTPARKIAFVTKTFKNAGIFSKIFIINRNNTKDKINDGAFYQELRIDIENESIEDLFEMFKQMVTSSNPIIKLTALDLIKYAYIVEGNSKRRGNITNIISNYAITNRDVFFSDRSLLDALNLRFNELSSNIYNAQAEEKEIDYIYKQFIRANSDIVPVKNAVARRKSKRGKGSMQEYTKGYNSYYIPIINKDGKVNEQGRQLVLDIAKEYNPTIPDDAANPTERIPIFIRLRHKVPVFSKDAFKKDETGEATYTATANKFIDQLFEVSYVPAEDGKVLGLILRGVSLLDKTETTDTSTNAANNYIMYGDKKVSFVYEGHAQYLVERIVTGNKDISFAIASNIIKANKAVANPNLTPDFINDALKSEIPHIKEGAEEIIQILNNNTADETIEDKGNIERIGVFTTNSRMEYMAKNRSVNSKSIVTINGVNYAVWITENASATRKFRKWLESGKPSKAFEIIKDRSANGVKSPSTSKLYYVNYQNIGDDTVAYSASTTIGYNPDVRREDSPFEQMRQAENVSNKQTRETVNFISEILSDIVNNKHHADNEFASHIKQYINTNHIKPESIHDIETYRKQLISLIKEYYQNRAAYFIAKFDDYLEDGTNISIDSDAMIEYLKEDDTRFNEFVQFLLEARNFGRSAKEYSAAINTGNKELDENINIVLNSVSKVLSNSKLNTAFRRVFNDYIAMRWSNNPNIRMGILDISTSFKDSNILDSWLASIYEIGNKEVQVVVNRVENILSQVARLTIPEQQDEFNRRFDEIMASGNVNMDNIIDSSTGKFIQAYNDRYVEDKQKIDDEVIEAGQKRDIARNNYYIALEKEEDVAKYAKEYEDALLQHAIINLKKEKWYAEHVEQPIIKQYYDEVIAYKDAILSSPFTAEYAKYLRLTEELNRLRANKQYYTIEESEQIHTIKEAIKTIVNPAAMIEIAGKRFPVEEIGRQLTANEQAQLDRINAQRDAFEDFLRAKKIVTSTYFDFEPSKDWIATKDRYSKFVEEFDAKNPDMDIEQKLRNEEYANAYAWLKINAVRSLGEEQQAIMNKYLSKLNSNKDVNWAVSKIIREAGAYDEFGSVDPTKLSDEDIQKIRNLYSKYYERLAQYDEDSYLIKDVPASSIMKKAYHDLFAGLAKESEAVREKRSGIIKQINEIISKGLDKQTNSIKTELLWANTTKEEREKLAQLYYELRDIKTGNKKQNKEAWEKIKEHVVRKVNSKAYEREKTYARTNLTKQEYNLWVRIFCDIDTTTGFVVTDKDGYYIANPYIYGYNAIKEDSEFNIYVDKDKTDAVRWVSNNTRSVVTDKYRNAEIQARNKGEEEYNKWFELNHFYNPVTHKYEPLRIWTTFEAKVGISKEDKSRWVFDDEQSDIIGDFFTEDDVIYDYEPTFEHKQRIIKSEYINRPNGQEYQYTNMNYRDNGSGLYSNDKVSSLTSAERAMLDLLTEYARRYAITDKAKRFTGRGYVPREYITPIDAKYVAKQVAGLAGVDYVPSNKSWYDVSYNDDILPPQDMYDIIKTKGYKQYIPYIEKPMVPNEENMRVYNETIAEIKKKNEEIRKHNLELERNYRNKDYKQVFNKLIATGEDYKARQDIKNLLFLLIEDFKANDETYSNKANRRNTRTGRILTRNKKNISGKKFLEEEQKNTFEVLSNYARRRIYGQYKQPSKYASIANMLQGITSAKYMYMNIPGGFANVYTGWTNIMGEVFGKDYIDKKYIREALYEYLVKEGSCLSYISDWWTVDKTHSKSGAIIDLFQVVDYDRVLNRESSEDIGKFVSRVREIMYSPQSMGEHFMQNTVLLAMMKSHKLYEVTDFKGNKVLKCGSFDNYTWNIEQQAMIATINKIANEHEHKDILSSYYDFIESKRSNIEELEKLDRFATNLNDEFLRTFGDNYREYAEIYINTRKEMLKGAKEKFETNPSLYDQYEFVDGKLKIKADSILIGKDGKVLPYYGTDIFGKFRNKVISVNEKIHGVYSRIGAAQIEKYWYGSLVTQYHKHIYPGIMKRFRGLFNREFYSEFRDSIEKGSYVSLYQLLTKELREVKNKVTNKKDKDAITTLDYVNETLHALVSTVTNLFFNYKMMSTYDQINVRRSLSDMLGATSAMLLAIALFAGTDDDDLKENNTLATALYLADRCYSESIMYTPYGMYVEGRTLWSSPIAMTNSITDVTKIAITTMSILFDEDYNPYYTTGQYKGQHKVFVAAMRNVPVYRVYNRMTHMNKNNKYYRLGDVGITKRARTIADYINPD